MTPYYSLISFLLVTVLYVVRMKPTLTVADVFDDETFANYSKRKNIAIGIYFACIVVTQLVCNVIAISAMCASSSKAASEISLLLNIGQAFTITLVPWVFIFGVMLAVLMATPSMVSVFANVLGYFFVNSRVNTLLTEMLVNPDISEAVSALKDGDAIQRASETILKVCGNASLVINQITPTTFNDFWSLLVPLMKPGKDSDPNKTELLDIVDTRYATGELTWYVYTGVLVIALSTYYISSRQCTQNVALQKATQDAYYEDEAKKAKEARPKGMPYNLS